MMKKKTTIEKDFFEEIKCKKSLIKKYYNIQNLLCNSIYQ